MVQLGAMVQPAIEPEHATMLGGADWLVAVTLDADGWLDSYLHESQTVTSWQRESVCFGPNGGYMSAGSSASMILIANSQHVGFSLVHSEWRAFCGEFW